MAQKSEPKKCGFPGSCKICPIKSPAHDDVKMCTVIRLITPPEAVITPPSWVPPIHLPASFTATTMLKRSYLNVFFYVKDIFGTTESNRWLAASQPTHPPSGDTVHEPAGCRYVSKVKSNSPYSRCYQMLYIEL